MRNLSLLLLKLLIRNSSKAEIFEKSIVLFFNLCFIFLYFTDYLLLIGGHFQIGTDILGNLTDIGGNGRIHQRLILLKTHMHLFEQLVRIYVLSARILLFHVLFEFLSLAEQIIIFLVQFRMVALECFDEEIVGALAVLNVFFRLHQNVDLAILLLKFMVKLLGFGLATEILMFHIKLMKF